MDDQAKHNKEILVAKMHQRTAIVTAFVGAFVTVIAAVLPTAINNFPPKDDVEQKSVTTNSNDFTPTPTDSSTPTPTEALKGRSKKE